MYRWLRTGWAGAVVVLILTISAPALAQGTVPTVTSTSVDVPSDIDVLIYLEAMTSGKARFVITEGPEKGSLRCLTSGNATTQGAVQIEGHGTRSTADDRWCGGVSGQNLGIVVYRAQHNASGSDRFEFAATLDGSALGPGGAITTDIRNVGLNWQIILARQTADSESTDAANDLNATFRLDWQMGNTWSELDTVLTRNGLQLGDLAVNDVGAASIVAAKSSAAGVAAAARPGGGSGVESRERRWKPNLKLSLSLGTVHLPVKTEVRPEGAVDDTTDETVQASRRAFQAGFTGYLNFATLSAGNGGAYTELGIAASADWNVLFNDDQIVTRDGTTFITVESPDEDFFNLELVARFRLSKARDQGNEQLRVQDNKVWVDHRRNLQDLLRVEAGYQRNNGLQGLAATKDGVMVVSDGRRFIARLLAFPGLPGTEKTDLALGIEYSFDLDAPDLRSIRVFYGFDFDLNKLF